MKTEYYMTLPSNSSATIFTDNTTTRFKTLLPNEWRLVGDWVVGLSEIIFPQTFSHIKSGSVEEGLVTTTVRVMSQNKDTDEEATLIGVKGSEENIPFGVYNTLEHLLAEINNLKGFREHFKLEKTSGSHIRVELQCRKECRERNIHSLALSDDLNVILGIEPQSLAFPREKKDTSRPASLRNALPSLLFVYTDICESLITGDVQTPLLRVVPTNLEHFEYGSTRLTTFTSPKYVPLLKNNFNTIEIDIRTEQGLPVPFDGGTLTVTLHFKRVD